jgi:hypothetical protein
MSFLARRVRTNVGSGGEGYSIFRLTKIILKNVGNFILKHFERKRLGTTYVAAVQVRGGWAYNARVHSI